MVKLQDISIYFSSNCCNKKSIENISQTHKTPVGKVSSLGETLPEKWHQQVENHFTSYKHLPLHEVCVTFTPKWRRLNALILHTKFKGFIQKFMAKHKDKRPWYVFYPEYSPKGYLHYHGIIYFDNANDYWTNEIKRLVRNKFGNTEGKEIYNFSKYYLYMTKDKNKNIGQITPFTNVKVDSQ